MRLVLGLACAYLLGAIPTSYLVGRWFGHLDLREHGSRNLGATNLLRVMGWRYAIPVGAFDVAKGATPVLAFAPWVGPADWIPILLGTAAVVGHVYSIFVRFRGGKGVATAAGAVLGVAPLALVISAVVWGVLVRATGYVSLGSVCGAVAFPVAVWLLYPGAHVVLGAGIALALFIVFTHRTNLRRLLRGQEARFGHRQATS